MNRCASMANERAHRALQENLPWLLNGTLGGAELDAAQAHLRLCVVCQADLARLRRLREAGAQTQTQTQPQCDPERALARLLPRLEKPAQAPAVRPAPGRADVPAPSLLRRAANDPHWLRRAAFFQCGVIVLLAALLAWPGETVDAYRALGAAPDAQAQAVVVFRPDTAERELRRIVRASGARIIGGPTVTDAYVLAMPDASASSLARLRAEPAVLLAEPLAAGKRP
jgi:hypothetical protein